MISMTLSSLRNSSNFFDIKDIATIINGKKHEEVGYFVPAIFKKEFEEFFKQLQKNQKLSLLNRVAQAQKKDYISDGAVADGI